MRVLVVNVCVLLVAFSVIHAQGRGGGSIRLKPPAVSAKSGNFLDHGDNSKNLLDLMKKHFDLSMKYLLTSKQYGSQYVERPGMAKLLNEGSSRHWEAGMAILNKFLQRGGSISDENFKPAFSVGGAPEVSVPLGEPSTSYINTLWSLLEDSKELSRSMNHLHHLGGRKADNGGDAEISHYFDEKLEKEAEFTRELAGHINTLQKMSSSGIAINLFDSNL